MSETIAPPRVVKFDDLAAVAGEVRRLRRGYRQRGHWSLPQTVWHLGLAIGPALKPLPPNAKSTPEQTEMKRTILDPLLATGTMPPGRPIRPGADPVTDAGQLGDSEIDRFLAALHDLDALDRPQVSFGPFGIVPTEDFKAFTRIHAANHLAHLIPNPPPRELHFADEDAIIADVQALRRGYEQRGDWTLPQICWHLAKIIGSNFDPPADPSAEQTPEQATRLQAFLARLATPGGSSHWPAPPANQPPPDAGDADIDRFIEAMRRLKAYPHKKIVMGPLGPASIADCRRAHLLHAAHHLGFLIPRPV